MPIIDTNYKQILEKINSTKYNIYGIASCKLRHDNYSIQKYKQSNDKLFKVKANIKSDCYSLYDNKDSFIDFALINTYKLSVIMNNIFRDIKENDNLDYQQESDDEDFENVNKAKYVNLDKEVMFSCKFNDKFKMWVPNKVIT